MFSQNLPLIGMQRAFHEISHAGREVREVQPQQQHPAPQSLESASVQAFCDVASHRFNSFCRSLRGWTELS